MLFFVLACPKVDLLWKFLGSSGSNLLFKDNCSIVNALKDASISIN